MLSVYIASSLSTQGKGEPFTMETILFPTKQSQIQHEQSVHITDERPFSHSQRRKLIRRQKHALANKTQRNAQYVRNLSDQSVSTSITNLVAIKGLKFIPTLHKPLNTCSLLRDFKGFRNRLRWSYIFSHREPKAMHPFYMKTNRNADPVASVQLESFLDNVRTDIAHTRFRRARDNLCPEERKA